MIEESLRRWYGTKKTGYFRKMILRNDNLSPVAAFYLIRYRLLPKERAIYHSFKLEKDLGDVLSDFYLYLRDGKTGNNAFPFKGMATISSCFMFERWVLRTFHNFLADEASREEKEREARNSGGERADLRYNAERDSSIRKLATYIAMMECSAGALERLILYRGMLGRLLSQSRLVPSHEIAPALGLTAENYRIKAMRLKKEMTASLTSIPEDGHHFMLPVEYRELSERIYRDFEEVDVILKELYCKALDELGCREAVERAIEEARARGNDVLFRRVMMPGNGETTDEPSRSHPWFSLEFGDVLSRRTAYNNITDYLTGEI